MKSKKPVCPVTTDLATGALRALRRAALVARKTARRYGPPVYYEPDGNVVALRT